MPLSRQAPQAAAPCSSTAVQGRLRSVLSDPSLAALALAAVSLEAEEAEEPPQQQQQRRRPPQPRRGLFACFARPAVVEAAPAAPPASPGWEREASTRSGRARGTSHELSAHSGRAPDWSSYSGRDASARSGGRAGEWSARSGRALGGSERSVRGGVARDPSVRGCHRATSVEVLCDTDTATWSPANFGCAPSSPSCQTQPGAANPCSRTSGDSCASGSVPLASPRGLLELSHALGASVDSLASGAPRVCAVPARHASGALPAPLGLSAPCRCCNPRACAPCLQKPRSCTCTACCTQPPWHRPSRWRRRAAPCRASPACRCSLTRSAGAAMPPPRC